MKTVRSARVVALVATTLAAVGACATSSHEVSPAAGFRSVPPSASSAAPPRPSAPPPATSSAPAPPPKPSCPDTGFDCDLQARFAEANAYVEGRPGTSGIVVHDLRTGAEWHNGHASDLTWTASTIKLAMVVDLYTRQRAGEISLTAEDRSLIHAMLHTSDDEAADTLWFRYAGADHMSFNDNFPKYGLTSLAPQSGFTEYYPYWGFQKCTPADLDRLMTYVLTQLPGDERSSIVAELRSVDPIQQWGVWGAGPAAHPGNKDGWSEEQGGWVMNTVGFVGDGERYVLTVMNNLRGEGGYDTGRATVTHVAELIFGGYFPG
ncbi:tat pathway signal sequence [Actinophytocola sp.]|uniref:tat pathway signal sequence n=1 Tax=Actinophytocola sp. TaxID=1872138 RepID=UPI0025C53074|nr:tat pathway signal sequence [Actinophytocola sp.]